MKITPLKMIRNVAPSLIGAFAMIVLHMILPTSPDILHQLIYIILSVVVYLSVVLLFSEERAIIIQFAKSIKLLRK